MSSTTVTTNRLSRHRRRHRGFSFAEVMFAVMLLGLGFIMVAAIFPVAIRQQQSSMEDSTGVAVAKQGAVIMEQMGAAFSGYHTVAAVPPSTTSTYQYTLLQDKNVTPAPANPVLHRFQDATQDPGSSYAVVTPISSGTPTPYDQMKGNLIQQSDSRYAWLPVAYQCQEGADYAQVYLVAVQVRNHEQFDARDRDVIDSFRPVRVFFKLTEGNTLPDTVTFYTDENAGTVTEPLAAVEGAYIWVADDHITNAEVGKPWVRPGIANGRYYRLGVKTDVAGTWQLQPGNDMTLTAKPGADNRWDTTGDNYTEDENIPPGPANTKAAFGFLVGRGVDYGNPGTAPNLNYTGSAMPVFALPPITVRLKP